MPNETATPAPAWTSPTITPHAPATRPNYVAEAEERIIAKFRAMLREGRGSMQITVSPGAVHFWRVLPDGRSEIG